MGHNNNEIDKIVGDTFWRNENGTDKPFQFVIYKAKVLSEITLTLQAEGDPSTFSMTINALRDNSEGEDRMMSLISYEDPQEDYKPAGGEDVGG